MLSPNQVVAVRKAIEMTYDCTCNVISQEKYVKDNKSTGFRENKFAENKKCKLSFETISKNSEDDIKSNVIQVTKLFIAPEITIKTGSRIEVTDVMGNEIKYTDGVISSKSGTNGDISYYQMTVPIQPGNSGGPLFDAKGNISGITSAGLKRELF